MFYIYLIILVLSLLSSWVILWKVPKLRTKNELSQNKSVSIIIPARNEKNNLKILLKSLQKQNLQPLETLVVDDHSEDQTATVAKRYGAKVIPLQPNETDWVGKSAGCWAGAQIAQGDWLLFLDADIFLPEETSLAKMIQQFSSQDGDGILSLQPYHTINSVYENLSAVFNIMVLAGMNNFSALGNFLEPAGAFGPSLLCNRETYFELGGHKSSKDSIMENMDLGKLFLDKNFPVSLFGGKDSLHFRMYPDGVLSLSQGWSKSFASASASTHPLILLGTSLWIAGAFVTFIILTYALIQGSVAGIMISLIGYLLYYIHFLRMARLAGNFNRFITLFYPILFTFFVFLFTWSAVKTFLFKTVKWKGRKINT